MARKNTSGRKPGGAAEITDVQDSAESLETPEAVTTSVAPIDEMPASKTRARAKEEPPPNSSVGIADIRKAVAFSNSVGGLDNAIALLQILKVAKEVQ